MRPEDPGGCVSPGSVCHSDSGKLYLPFHEYKIPTTRTVSMVTVGGGAGGQTEAVFRCEHVGIIQLIQHRHRALNTPAHTEESQKDGAAQSEPVISCWKSRFKLREVSQPA